MSSVSDPARAPACAPAGAPTRAPTRAPARRAGVLGAAAALCMSAWCHGAEALPDGPLEPVRPTAVLPEGHADGGQAGSDLSARNKPDERLAEPAAAPAQAPTAPTAPTAPAAPAAPSGLVAGSKLNVVLRHYAEYLEVEPAQHRNGWVQSMRAMFESGYTDGPVGFGVDLAPYAALKLDGGRGTRNMVRVGPGDSRAGDAAWAYIGGYAFKARVAGVIVKYGLQSIANPFLDPYDIRALPPSFRGLSFAATPHASLALSGGSIDSMIVRGATYRQPLATGYGGIAFERMDWAGADWTYSPRGKLSLYANRARDLWDQQYLSLAHSVDGAGAVTWTGNADIYFTRDRGRQLQGAIDNKAFSLSLTAVAGPSTLSVGFQRVLGEQFFDFLQETSGIYLYNAMGTDYNAPHERSVQLRYKLDGAGFGLPGFQTMVWGIAGWGADARAEAARYPDPAHPLNSLYWRAGQPVGGSHKELGIKFTHAPAAFKGAKVSLLMIAHNISPQYPSKTFRDLRFIVDVPFKVF